MGGPDVSDSHHDGRTIAGFALRVLIVIALGALALALWRLHDVLLLLFAAVLVAVILDAAAGGLRRLVPIGRGVALLAAGLLIVAALAGVGVLFGHQIGTQLSGLGAALPDAWRRFAE